MVSVSRDRFLSYNGIGRSKPHGDSWMCCNPLGRLAVGACVGMVMMAGCVTTPTPRLVQASDTWPTDREVVLAADFGQDPRVNSSKNDSGSTVAEPADPVPVPAEGNNSQATVREKKKPTSTRKTYTVPGTQAQQLAALALGITALGTGADVSGAGREVAESGIGVGQAALGRPGLTAPQPRVASAVVGRPGLQQGFAAGLGFASSDRNIFTARMNPLSGPNGRCQDLASTGFFGGSRSACESHFRR